MSFSERYQVYLNKAIFDAAFRQTGQHCKKKLAIL